MMRSVLLSGLLFAGGASGQATSFTIGATSPGSKDLRGCARIALRSPAGERPAGGRNANRTQGTCGVRRLATRARRSADRAGAAGEPATPVGCC